MTIPEWFVKDLEVIDTTYFVVPNEEFGYFEIKKRLDIERKDKINGVKVRVKDPTVAVFKSLNEDALLSLRKRKYDGLRYRQDMMAYLKDIKRHNEESRKKAIEIAREQVAEGFIKIFNWGKKKYYLTPARRETT